jgi:hypothetical protein
MELDSRSDSFYGACVVETLRGSFHTGGPILPVSRSTGEARDMKPSQLSMHQRHLGRSPLSDWRDDGGRNSLRNVAISFRSDTVDRTSRFNYMHQNPSWETDSRIANQDIPFLSCILGLYCHVRRSQDGPQSRSGCCGKHKNFCHCRELNTSHRVGRHFLLCLSYPISDVYLLYIIKCVVSLSKELRLFPSNSFFVDCFLSFPWYLQAILGKKCPLSSNIAPAR